MELVTQAEYARQNNISRAAVTQIKEKLVLRPHPVTGKLMVDKEATDIATGRKADPAKKTIYQKQNNRADEHLLAANITVKSKAQYEHYKAQNEKLKYEIESGKYILKDEVEKQGAELGSFIKSSMENLKAKIRNNYSLDIYQKLEKDIDSMLKKLAALDND